MKLKKQSTIILISFITVFTTSAKDDVILGDFENGTYNDWTIEGNAFGAAPAAGTIG